MIRIKDIDHKEIVIDHNLSGSDHFQSLIYNLISDGFKYNISEEAYNVVNSSNGDISEDMISSYIEDPNEDTRKHLITTLENSQKRMTIWIEKKESKYHSCSDCSNIKTSTQIYEDSVISINSAIRLLGLSRCGKCW